MCFGDSSQYDSSRSWADPGLRHWLPSPAGGDAQGSSVSPLRLRHQDIRPRQPWSGTENFPCRNDLVQRKPNFPNAWFLCWLNDFFKLDLLLILTIPSLPSTGLAGERGRLWTREMLGPFPLVNRRWPSYFSSFLGRTTRGFDRCLSR